jgi:hypothetical protein
LLLLLHPAQTATSVAEAVCRLFSLLARLPDTAKPTIILARVSLQREIEPGLETRMRGLLPAVERSWSMKGNRRLAYQERAHEEGYCVALAVPILGPTFGSDCDFTST